MAVKKDITKKIKNKINRQWLIIVFAFIIIFILASTLINQLDFSSDQKAIKFGVSFSHKYASETLGLDWTEVYWEIINDLKVTNLRLIAHWDQIETQNNHYNFNELEWMIDQAEKKDINVILVIGRRTPRWPECHDPDWIASLNHNDMSRELLQMLEELVLHFKKYNNIVAWQVENEPFLSVFGLCPPPDKQLIKQEVDLVKSLDPRPIIVTDSGELSSWREAASLADIFGTTMYKTVWNRFLGTWRYPLPPLFYYYKSNIVKNKYDLDTVIVSELQAEPWVPEGMIMPQMSLRQQFNSFNLNDFKNNIEFATKAGFDHIYLWGVEWWYWLKKTQNRPEFWNEAKLIWQNY